MEKDTVDRPDALSCTYHFAPTTTNGSTPPKTGEHDYQVKLKRCQKFLTKGYKVQVNVLEAEMQADIGAPRIDPFEVMFVKLVF